MAGPAIVWIAAVSSTDAFLYLHGSGGRLQRALICDEQDQLFWNRGEGRVQEWDGTAFDGVEVCGADGVRRMIPPITIRKLPRYLLPAEAMRVMFALRLDVALTVTLSVDQRDGFAHGATRTDHVTGLWLRDASADRTLDVFTPECSTEIW